MNNNKRRIAAFLGALSIILGGCTIDSQANTNKPEDLTIEQPNDNEMKENTLLKNLRTSYIDFKGKEDYTVLNASYDDICKLYKQAYTLVYNYECGIPQSETDQKMAEQLIEIFSNTNNPILAICNIHNLYVLEFYYVYPDEVDYYDFYGEIAKNCTNEENVDDVYTRYTNLASLLHLKACEEEHVDVSLNTNEGYKYMYECAKLPYGPRNTYTTKLILK